MLKFDVHGNIVGEMGEPLTCSHCGSILTESDVKSHDDGSDIVLHTDSNGDYYCEDCSEDLVECHDCGEVYHRDDMQYVDSVDDYVCEGCLDNNYSRCENCDELVPNGDLETVTVWEDGRHVRRRICDYCLDENYRVCDDCGVYVHEDDACWSEYHEVYYCPDCYGEDCLDTSGICDYHFSDDPAYNMPYLGVETRNIDLLKGWELEVEKDGGWERGDNPSEDADTVKSIIGEEYCVVCHDGSLCDGFEIISCPATTKHHLNTLKIKEGVEWLAEHGYISHKSGNCGLHVHLDRKFFGNIPKEDVEGRFFIILRNNLSWIKLFSRRYRWGYCKINGYDNSFDGEGDSLGKISYPPDKVWLNSKKQNERHMALNFYPYDTIEIRIFRGTLRYDTIVATLQFCDLWADIVKRYDNRQTLDVNLQTFMNRAYDKGYTKFIEYLRRRAIIDNPNEEF